MTEQNLEQQFIEWLKKIGWKYVPAAHLERNSLEDVLLERNLKEAIEKINKSTNIPPEEITRRIYEFKMIPTTEEGIKKALHIIKYGIKVEDKKEKILKNLQFIDYDNIGNNEFIVTNQPVYKSGEKEIRNDIVLYVNGIPLVNIELKSPESARKSWLDAANDIKIYWQKVPELYKYIQIGIGADIVSKYFSVVPWEDELPKIYEWKAIGLTRLSNDIKNTHFEIIEMLEPTILLDIIRYYLFLREERGKKTKVICRYMQYRAADKIIKRVIGRIKGEKEKDRGLIWHWQGSGKTLTMIFAANKLLQLREMANPSIFFIVDREELETQLYDEFGYLDLFSDMEMISSIEDLINILKHDNYKGKRGVFLTLIHKFKPEQLKDFEDEMKKIEKEINNIETGFKSASTIARRKNVVCFIDEGHRTQYGILSAQMKRIFKSGNLFAFTGTPISNKEKNTYKEFEYEDKLYLDRYFMEDSVRDGYTLKIAYQPRLTKEVHIKKELIKIFYEQDDIDEISDDMKKDIEKGVKEKLNKINVVLENPEKIKIVAKDIANHFKENLYGRFKAIILATSRHACCLYKEELDKYFGEDETEIVMTMGPKETDAKIAAQYDRITSKYNEKNISLIKKKLTAKFKESAETNPKILIVVDMLITGFDAPVLQTVYLHKALKNYRLLQAIARTNRPYTEKEAGLVIDYVGILDDLDKAFKSYEENDRDRILYDFQSMEKEFEVIINDLKTLLSGKAKYDKYDINHFIEMIKFLSAVDRRQADFEEKYRKARRLYELLGSSDIKIAYINEYKWFTAFYSYLKKNFSEPEKDYYVNKYFKKTLENIYKGTEIKGLEELPSIVYDETKMRELLKKIDNTESKAANMIFSLRKYILVDKAKNPIYEGLVEKVRRLIQEWQNNVKNYLQVITEAERIFKEKDLLEYKQKQLGLDNIEYVIFLRLKKEGLQEDEALQGIKEIKERIKEEGEYMLHYIANPEISKITKQIIRRIFRRKGFTPEKLDSISNNIVSDIIGVKENDSEE
ncbi:MAG: HsdR family type I site-specific deoxyribonuclease [Candidatus Goldbacteria bacterium]|nr:HsdR family type I site-specific deoxyribonuclease [Candidatus Goldiibacteriota bacterium]